MADQRKRIQRVDSMDPGLIVERRDLDPIARVVLPRLKRRRLGGNVWATNDPAFRRDPSSNRRWR
jgi:hypothetical protein